MTLLRMKNGMAANRSMEDLWDGNSGKMTGGAPSFSQGRR